MEFGIPMDENGKYVTELFNKKLFLFDMDGTIYTENIIIDGTLELLNIISILGGNYVFITNNSSRSVKDYIAKVNSLGIDASEDNFFTSTQATVIYLKKYFPEKKIYCQGTKSFIAELIKEGINVTCKDEEDIGAVVVAFDTELSSEKLRETCMALQRNVTFIATNPDIRCPVLGGYIPDCGSICRMLTLVTGKEPIYIGKPEAIMVNQMMQKYNCDTSDTVVIGDRLYTDIATGINAGVTSVCVLTGEATLDDIMKGDIKPSLTFNSVMDIYRALNQFRLMSMQIK